MYNKNNPNYKLYLAGIITENQYYEMLENNENKKKIFVLVGPPAVGKSTWIKNTFQKDDPYIINRDAIVEEVASQMEMTYDDMFSAPPKDSIIGTEDEKYGTVVSSPSFMTWQPLSYSNILDANKLINDKLNDKIKNAATSGRDIVVDMTNMTANARKQALKSISGKEDMFHKVAVVFPFHGAEHIIKKMAFKRSQEIKKEKITVKILKDGILQDVETPSFKSKTIPPEVIDRMMKSFQEIAPEEGFDEVVEMDNRQKLKELLGEN
jgi:predicted kinase